MNITPYIFKLGGWFFSKESWNPEKEAHVLFEAEWCEKKEEVKLRIKKGNQWKKEKEVVRVRENESVESTDFSSASS